jgi:hypothetical protein
MIKTNKVKMEQIDLMFKDNYNNLTSPMDDMYELGIIPSCDFYEIEDEDGLCGFFATNSDNVMLQFYVKDNARKDISMIFETVISQNKISKALSCTNDPIYHSLCEKQSTNIITNDYMFLEDEVVINPMPFDGIVMSYAIMDELDEVMSYFAGIGMTGDWLAPYLTQRITQCQLILFRYNREIIGTGETRPSISSKGYANIGMSVSIDYRRRGLGSYIISIIRKITNENGYKAICSTEKMNIGSFNTLTKSGFVRYHTIDEITF